MMKELHLLMEEDYVDDIRADDTVLKVSNITLDCDLALPAILRHEPADMDINAVYNLIPQPSVILPFNCDQKSADRAIVSGGDSQLMATINVFTSEPQIMRIFEYGILAASQQELLWPESNPRFHCQIPRG